MHKVHRRCVEIHDKYKAMSLDLSLVHVSDAYSFILHYALHISVFMAKFVILINCRGCLELAAS